MEIKYTCNDIIYSALFSSPAEKKAPRDHGPQKENYRLISSAGKVVAYFESEYAGVKGFDAYYAKFPQEIDDGASLQHWISSAARWTTII